MSLKALSLAHVPFPDLPEPTTWRLDEVRAECPERATALEGVGTPAKMLEALATAFESAVDHGEARFGREQAEDARGGFRAVVQFGVPPALFDWFFNARTGYRAHFRVDPRCGLEFNDRIIEVVRDLIQRTIPSVVAGREIVGKFEDGGAVLLPREFFADSLVPTLSKIWWCTRRMRVNGGIDQLATGLMGPRLDVGGTTAWAAPSRDREGAWLDVYGAFLGHPEPYQPKDPYVRAKSIHLRGEA